MRDRTAVPGTSQTESPHFNSYHTVVNTKPHDYLSVHEFVRNSLSRDVVLCINHRLCMCTPLPLKKTEGSVTDVAGLR